MAVARGRDWAGGPARTPQPGEGRHQPGDGVLLKTIITGGELRVGGGGWGGLEFVNIIWNALHTVHQLGSAQPALIRHCNYLEYVLILPQSETQYLVVSFPTYAELFRELE